MGYLDWQNWERNRMERQTPTTQTSTGVVPGSNQDPFWLSTGKTETVVINGKSYTGINVGSTKPPAALEIGLVSPASGLTITGTERNMAKEREAMNIGYTKEYIASRGGINSQGYFNDTPLSGQLSAAEQKQVTLANGRVDTIAMAKILQDKKREELKKQGLSSADIEKKLNEEWGQLYTALGQTGGFDANGNPTPGGQYDSTGKFVGASAPGSSPGAGTDNVSQEKRDAYSLVEQTMRSYGFNEAELTEILNYIKTGLVNPRMGANQLVIELRNLPSYKARFAGNETRRKAGLNVLSEAEYLAQEKDYSETLRRYGQQRLANRAQFATLIGNDISNTELGSRVGIAVNRLSNTNPAVLGQLRTYYPTITNSDIVAYFLSPTETLPELETKVATAEIGATAAQYGLQSDLSRISELQRYGVDLARARQGYENIANILPRTELLSDIYKQAGINYNQTTAEQEEFKGLASARRARNQLSQLETAAFSGASGLGRTSLTRNIGGTI
jgi:hypothetical protein